MDRVVPRPLDGRVVVVTRARAQAAALSRLLMAAGATPLEVPLIRIEPPTDLQALDTALRTLHRYDWLVVTSVNGVQALRTWASAVAGTSGATLPTRVRPAAVGPKVAAALRSFGIEPAYVPDDATVAALARGLPLIEGERVLLLQADIAPPTLADLLRSRGAIVDAAIAYRTVREDVALDRLRDALDMGTVDAVTFASGSAIRELVAALGGADLLATTVVACIGESTAAVARSLGVVPAVIAKDHTAEGLVRALEGYVAGQGRTAAPTASATL